MALNSAPSSYPSDLESYRATRTPQRISSRKEVRTWTADTYAPYDDGHQWRKYGEKKLSNSNFPRFYYRCTYKNDMKCPGTKQVQQKDTNDPPLFSVTYFNQHTCNSSSIGGTTPDIAAESSSRKAVSICFNSHATTSEQPTFLSSSASLASSSRKAVSICFNSHATTSEQPTFLSSSASLAPPSIQSSRSNQQPDMSAYARQFQWADYTSSSTSNAPVKTEIGDYAEASASPNSTGALSRTLLPISQSRCIEYFHFL